ncbi:CDP-2,3-bis-(O-geranylgeranyl)-sn-glycerol synthase [Candidatus Micrarchaeota archaeon]|nr:MAG: CDP-2,3-bis-(O-geranylgeranyl)-sn-glycerol synthase [Candidatus Micrarchaeota archaeon]
MDSVLAFIANSFIFILPAYIANASPILFGNRWPIDRGKKWFDGRPILGKGKTWAGLISGLSLGTLTGLVVAYVLFPNQLLSKAYLAFMMSLGALIFDMITSFVKRRLGYKRGELFPFFDQADFVLGAFAFTFFIEFPGLDTFLFLIVITPAIHLSTNFIAYKLGLKSVPW